MKKSLLFLLCVLLLASPSWAAFPQVVSSTTSTEAATTDITVTLPATINAGDLMLVFVTADGAGSFTWPGGWAEIYDQSTSNGCHLTVGYKIAVGDEDGTTIEVTGSGADASAHASFSISGHNSGQAPEASAEGTGTTGPDDPPSLTPTGGAKDYLWFAASCHNDGPDYTAAPTNYGNLVFVEVGSFPGMGVARRELNAASEDPGGFTTAAGISEWNAATIAVHPAIATATSPQVIVVE